MTYNQLNTLTVYETTQIEEYLSFEILDDLLTSHPSSTVYVTSDGILYGLISMGDIYKAYKNGKRYVLIKKNFSRICKSEYRKARRLLNNINALPVVDESGKLIGGYTRWNDAADNLTVDNFIENHSNPGDWDNKRVYAIVRPEPIIAEKTKISAKWFKFLKCMNLDVRMIGIDDIASEMEDKQYLFLFTDQDEKRGKIEVVRTLRGGTAVEEWRTLTFSELRDRINSTDISNRKRKLIHQLIMNGVNVYYMVFNKSLSDYWSWLNNDIEMRFRKIGISKALPVHYEAFARPFYGSDVSDDYINEVYHLVFHQKEGFVTELNDVSGKYLNVRNGVRHTANQPECYRGSIYFFGPCIVVGEYVDDSNTIESKLQNRLNDMEYHLRAVNMGSWSTETQLYNKISNVDFHNGDTVIIYDEYDRVEEARTINIAQTLEDNNVAAKNFIDSPLHCNAYVNGLYADAIYSKLLEDGVIDKMDTEHAKKYVDVSDVILDAWLSDNFHNYVHDDSIVTGAIVMNCNPFTYGHRYLIEQVCNYVDRLIIFVVEEDASEFNFSERYAMISEGTKNLDKVMVVPSGPLILSKSTFPEYFGKVFDDTTDENIEKDIRIFGSEIASSLGITYRFVGEEPEDKLTNAYNKGMKDILSEYGVKLVEIPRLENASCIICASKVRKMLAEENYKGAMVFLPKTDQNVFVWEME